MTDDCQCARDLLAGFQGHPPTREGQRVRVTALGDHDVGTHRHLAVGHEAACLADGTEDVAYIDGFFALVAALGDQWEIIPTPPARWVAIAVETAGEYVEGAA